MVGRMRLVEGADRHGGDPGFGCDQAAEGLVVAPEAEGPDGRQRLEAAVVRFAGDSGDGMQLTGSQFTLAAAVAGNDLVTFPDFPAEIRAPVGTTFGVSTFQINFGTREIRTAGDALDVLVVMNPAALITNLGDLREDGLLIVDENSFQERNLKKAGYETNPLEDGSLDKYRMLTLEISKFAQNAAKASGATASCSNPNSTARSASKRSAVSI